MRPERIMLLSACKTDACWLLAVNVDATSRPIRLRSTTRPQKHSLCQDPCNCQGANMQLFYLKMAVRSEEHTSELQSLMRISYAVFCLKIQTNHKQTYMNKKSKHNT